MVKATREPMAGASRAHSCGSYHNTKQEMKGPTVWQLRMDVRTEVIHYRLSQP